MKKYINPQTSAEVEMQTATICAGSVLQLVVGDPIDPETQGR